MEWLRSSRAITLKWYKMILKYLKNQAPADSLVSSTSHPHFYNVILINGEIIYLSKDNYKRAYQFLQTLLGDSTYCIQDAKNPDNIRVNFNAEG